MFIPSGYTILRTLRATSRSEVRLARREADGCEVILKAYASAVAAERGHRAEREFEALRALAGPGMPQGIELLWTASEPILVLERAPGVLLAELAARRLGAEQWVEVALQLAQILVRIHAAHWLHRDVTPHNVLVEPKTLRVHLIDFGIARRLGTAAQPLGAADPDEFAGTLAYMAPEQTGRMNRGVDARSDLYALGATLYFALAGRPPFEGDDVLALINAHIAVVPRPPGELRPDAPEVFSRIVLRLLQKEPADRYQSAGALAADLRLCQVQLAQGAPIDERFQLGTGETPERPRFAPKLYGRAAEIARLHELYARAAAGSVQVLMLAGEPGVGKSLLVDELPRRLAESGGYLAIGVFDSSQDRPYAAWSAALGAFVQ